MLLRFPNLILAIESLPTNMLLRNIIVLDAAQNYNYLLEIEAP
jgi:hypothetical protein